MFSNTAIIVERAANVRNRKKSAPQILPPAMEAKIFGSVINIRLGPLFGSTPYEKQAGKIIRPDTIATNVSSTTMFIDSPKRAWSLPI